MGKQAQGASGRSSAKVRSKDSAGEFWLAREGQFKEPQSGSSHPQQPLLPQRGLAAGALADQVRELQTQQRQQ